MHGRLPTSSGFTIRHIRHVCAGPDGNFELPSLSKRVVQDVSRSTNYHADYRYHDAFRPNNPNPVLFTKAKSFYSALSIIHTTSSDMRSVALKLITGFCSI